MPETWLYGQVCCELPKSHSEPLLKFLDELRAFPYGLATGDPCEERIETERHDYTQSTTTVGRGVVQVESGYLHFYNEGHAH